ncbi:hypothetical protein E4L95_12920 [Paracoccus liaowanqingii]|uniref:DUF2125 domain-containing protein n=1 Tax=Paracoccus liaowanqingii TaxID=2560053 RepID=A0A4Z1BYY4_9RHOB|nr:DUF2125 domain-containing protein [Paracoccus liaowanqingii]TGN57852.1 hypothetical protein E4L95_12920 [Paracoccus liaowanqingii]
MYRPLATSAMALILGAGPLLADVTPNEVWQNLRDGYEQMGYQVRVGSEEGSGDRLTLTDVVLTAEEETASDMTLTLPRIDLAATGDGAVRSVVEGQMVLQMRDTDPEGEEVGMTLTLDAPGNETLSSGTADEMQHSFVMPTLVLEGRALDDTNEVPVTATLTNVEGTQTTATAADGSATQTYQGSADMLEMQVSATGPAATMPEDEATGDAAPEGGADATAPADGDTDTAIDSFDATVRISDLTLEGEGTSPAGEITFGNQPAAALEAGASGAGRFAMGAIAGSFTSATTGLEGEDATASGEFTAASGALAVSMSAEGLTYEGSATDMATQMTSSGMPFPISYAAALNSFRLAMPVVASEEEQPFALRYALEGLTLDDAIWQALDPEAALPRDPASLTLDLDGQTILSQNFMDPTFADGTQTGPDGQPQMPFLPRSLSINDLSLDAVGASVQMSGDLTFGDDPSQPVGTITGLFSGIDTLLDSLAAMGVVPQDQLMAPRMMMAMFARPVEGNPDQLQTEIEFREGGSVFANGQQIQ